MASQLASLGVGGPGKNISPMSIIGLLAWFKAEKGLYDNTSGGNLITADGSPIVRWADQSGNGNDLTQNTSENQCVLDAALSLVCSEVAQGGAQVTEFFNAPSIAVNSQAFSLFVICELSTLLETYGHAGPEPYHLFMDVEDEFVLPVVNGPDTLMGIVDNTNTLRESTTVPATSRCLLGWVGDSSACRIYFNNNYDSISAINGVTTNMTALLGDTAKNYPSQAGVKEIIYYDAALTDAQVQSTIWPYAQGRGVPGSYVNQLVCQGDSISAGTGAGVLRCWSKLVRGCLPANLLQRVIAQGGITLASLASSAAALVDPLIVPGQTNILCIFAGTNDISQGGGGATVQTNTYNALVTYCQARQAAGWQVIVFTALPRSGTTYSTYNNAITANWTTFANALCDVASNTYLSNSTNTTYFNTDQIHPTTLGHAVIAGLAQAQINTLLSLPSAAPTVFGVSPANGIIGGGTIVTLTGTDFTNTATAYFNGVAAGMLTFNSPASISVTAPSLAAGVASITVTTTAGTSTPNPAATFNYNLTLLVDDQMAGTNGELLSARAPNVGSAPTAGAGGGQEFTIESGVATVLTGISFDVYSTTASDVTVTGNFASGSANDEVGIVFRYQDDGNVWYFEINLNNGNTHLFEYVGNVQTSRGSGNVSIAASTGFTMQIVCSGSSINCLINGVSVTTYTSTDLETKTSHGLIANWDLTGGGTAVCSRLTITTP